MNNIEIKNGIIPNKDLVYELYSNVGWTAYTNDMDNLMEAIENSLRVITAWDQDKLIALLRIVGDGYSIIYIQDILILEDYQGIGLGSKLIQLILADYSDVRQIILATDNTDKTRSFYESNGFRQAKDYNCVSYMKINM